MDPLEIAKVSIAVVILLLLSGYITRHTLAAKWPFLGTLPWLLLNLDRVQEQFSALLQRSNGSFLLKGPWFSNMDILLSADPADVHYTTSSNFSSYPKGSRNREIFDIMGDAVFNSDGDLWKLHRHIIESHNRNHVVVLHTAKTLHIMLEQGLVPQLHCSSKHNHIVDMQDLFMRFTLDFSSKLVTGHDTQSLCNLKREVPLARALHDGEEAVVRRFILPAYVWKLLRWLHLGHERRLSEAWREIDHFFYNIISKKRRDEHSESSVDYLTTYMRAMEEIGGNLNNDKFLRDSTLHLLIASRDTTASALTWLLWLILSNPTIEDKIRAEIRSNIPAAELNKRHIFHEYEIKDLVYLHATVCEALRLYPPAPLQYKLPVEKGILPSGHQVHSKMRIIFPLYAMARMKMIWGENCSEFDPDRWISKGGNLKHVSCYKFFTFNAGPRVCTGKGASLSTIKVVIATLIHNFQFQAVEDQVISPDFSAILHMKHGFNVKVSNMWN